MATAKKTTAKKTTATSKKAPVSKPVAKKASAAKNVQSRSFKLSANQPSFTTFAITRQTIYWVILVSIIIFFQLWILNLQLEVSELIEMQRISIESM